MDDVATRALPPLPSPLPAALTEVSRRRTLLMGVVNVTPDSFSDGGRWLAADAALAHAHELVAQGADIIDVGGESTRPGASRVSPDEELRRVLPVVRELVADGVVVSVDTIHAATAEAVAQAGAQILNDVSGGLADARMHAVVADTGRVYVCQHWRGNPETMDQLTDYSAYGPAPDGGEGGDVLAGVVAELSARLAELEAAGVRREQVVVDPGLGFAKTHPQSWRLLAHTADLRQAMGLPVLIGTSRKRFLAGALPEGRSGATDRDAATAATSALAAAAGAWAVRVHELPANRDAVMTASLWKDAR